MTRFVEGDVRNFREGGPFDAVIARLLLFHLSDAVDVVRYQLGRLKPSGVVLAIDFDVGAARAEPASRGRRPAATGARRRLGSSHLTLADAPPGP